MATIPPAPIQLYGNPDGGPLSIVLQQNSITPVRGQALRMLAGFINPMSTANIITNAEPGAGFSQITSAALTSTALVPILVLAPNVFYEATCTGTPSTANLLSSPTSANSYRVTAADGTIGFAILGAAGSTGVAKALSFYTLLSGIALHPFIGKSDASATAPQIVPTITDKGTSGDTTPRVLTTFSTLGCQLFS